VQRRQLQAPCREQQDLAEAILKEGAARAAQTAAEVTTALAVERAHLTDEELQAWREDLEERLRKIHHHPEQNLGFIEEEVARGSREPLRLLTQRAAQAKANATPNLCPHHQIPLQREQVLAARSDGPATGPFTLVIEIDAWNIRERDDWGRTLEARKEALRQNKEVPSKWHWVYVATVFRLDHRGTTAADRPVISQRRYASTRLGIEDLMRQLYRQAIDCGLGQAQEVLVIADGALWIWTAVQDRFPDARCRVDLFHGDEHLWTTPHQLYGKDTPEAAQWVEPLLILVTRRRRGPHVLGNFLAQ
jgi:hypothetical protein